VIRARATSRLRGGDHQAGKRGVIGEGEHGSDTAGNSPLRT